MAKVNDNYLKLPGSYLFSTVAKKAAAYTEANPDKEVIKMSIGDVTKPLAPAVIEASTRQLTKWVRQRDFTATVLSKVMIF